MRRAIRRRIYFYGGVVAAVLGFYFYQPIRIDLFPRAVPSPNPLIDPDSKELLAKGAKVVILTAHPDDAEYYAGGLEAKLQKVGAEVSLVVLTDGDKSFYPFVDSEALRKIRRAEQSEAAAKWGAKKVTFLGFRDGRLVDNDETRRAAQDALRGAKWVVTFDGDYPPKVSHNDHRTAGLIAEEAARKAGAQWLVRFATHAANWTFDLSGFDIAQRDFLDTHRSQFSGEKEQKVWGTIFEAGMEDGERIGKDYGLAVRVTQL